MLLFRPTKSYERKIPPLSNLTLSLPSTIFDDRESPCMIPPMRSCMITERHGSLLLDALLAFGLFGMVVASFATAALYGQRGLPRAGDRTRAHYLAQEGIDAMRSIRDREGFDVITERALDDPDGVAFQATEWVITDEPTTIDTLYTRTITFTGSAHDERTVTSTVTWNIPGSTQSGSLSLSTVFTNWQTGPDPIADWTQPMLVSSIAPAALSTTTLQKIEVLDGIAYVAADGAQKGLHLFDVSDSANPVHLKHVPLNGAAARDIAVRGDYAYMMTNDGGWELKVLSIAGDPMAITCCTTQINLPGTKGGSGIAITGTGLFVTNNDPNPVSNPEVYIFDIADDPTLSSVSSPPVVSDASVETLFDAGTRAPVGIAGTGSHTKLYAYVATNLDPQHLTVVSSTGSGITGGGKAHTPPQEGLAVITSAHSAFLGTKGGGSPYEVFSWNIANTVHDPSTAPGEFDQFDLGGENLAESSIAAFDFAIDRETDTLFIATNRVLSCTPGPCKNHYLHILDITDPGNISSPAKTLYDGTGGTNVTDGKAVQLGLFHDRETHLLYMVGGTPGELIIIRPTLIYGN